MSAPTLHRLVYSAYRRNDRDEVLVLRDDKGAELVHLHPGLNAVDGDAWKKVAAAAAPHLASKAIADKGDAPEVPSVDGPAPDAAEAPAGAADKGAGTPATTVSAANGGGDASKT